MNAPVPHPAEIATAALMLFRAGLDTHDIARRMGVPESVASRYVWVARSREKGLPVESAAKRGDVP